MRTKCGYLYTAVPHHKLCMLLLRLIIRSTTSSSIPWASFDTILISYHYSHQLSSAIWTNYHNGPTTLTINLSRPSSNILRVYKPLVTTRTNTPVNGGISELVITSRCLKLGSYQIITADFNTFSTAVPILTLSQETRDTEVRSHQRQPCQTEIWTTN